MNKHVFEKIAKLEKTELSEVKVELAQNLAQLQKLVLTVEKSLDSYNKLYEQLLSTKNKLVPIGDEIVKIQNELNTSSGFFEKAFKDLGMNFNETPEYKSISSFMSRSRMVGSMNQQIKQL